MIHRGDDAVVLEWFGNGDAVDFAGAVVLGRETDGDGGFVVGCGV